MRGLLIVHDFDSPLFTRKTCFRRAFWLITYALFGWSEWIRQKIPKWLMNEKYSQAKSLALLDKMLNIDAVFAFRKEIDKVFPSLREEIKDLGFAVVNHWHENCSVRGYNEWMARGNWFEVEKSRTYLNYDRHYVLGEEVIPDEGTNIIWHVDHMSYNLFFYLQFLREMKLVDS